MPRIDDSVFAALEQAPDAPAVAPRHEGGLWEPLCARYGGVVLAPARRALDASRLSLQRLLDDVGAVALTGPENWRALTEDWDTDADVDRLRS